MTNTASSLFKNPYLAENTSKSDMNQLYQQLEVLKAQKQNNYNTLQQLQGNQAQEINNRNVYTDIASLWQELSEDERKFIEESEEYSQASLEYQTAFNNFLTEKLSGEFLSSKYGNAPEKVLAVIKKKREEYKDNRSNDISDIKSQNAQLLKQNQELAKSNEEMQSLLKKLQEKIWVQQ